MLDGLIEKFAGSPQFVELGTKLQALLASLQRIEFNQTLLAELERRRDPKAYAEAAKDVLARMQVKP